MISKATNTLQELARFLPTQDRCLLDQLLEEAVDVIIFGSRAVGVHSKASDLDVFCVGLRERYKSERLDIVSRKSSEVEDRKWLGSELANHIVSYGIVVRGSADWMDAVMQPCHIRSAE
jgi:predicted nucleotidyltransferase